jgi:signal transduction histidine kinase/sensor domain CHASE-containing protein/ActR/RegA family two-component response regulator
MTLARQTALLLGLLLVVLTAACAGLFWAIFSPLFSHLEQEDTAEDGLIVAGLLLDEADGLAGTTGDWATWDETWLFMRGEDSTFLDRNLDSQVFRNIDIRALALVDTAGDVVAGLENTGDEGSLAPLGRETAALLSSGLADSAARGGSLAGFVMVGGTPCALAIQPVFPTIGTGPGTGGLVFVRDLAPVLRRLAQQLHGSTITVRPSAGQLPESGSLVTSSSDTIRAEIGLPTVSGPDLELSIARPRDTYAAFASILRHVTLFLAASGLLYSLVTLALMHRLVVSRLSRMLRRLLPAGAGRGEGRASGRLDEVEQLQKAMDPLLARLESATSELRESERKTSAILGAMPDFVVILDASGKILRVHAGYGNEQVISPEKTARMTLEEFNLRGIGPGEIRERISRSLRTSCVERFDFGLEAGGAVRSYGASMVAIGDDQVIVVIRDETQRRLMEREAARIEKLESLGILAGGIAHDFNNCLAAVLGNLDIASILPIGEKASSALERARSACEAAKLITLRLLTFSPGGEPMRQPVHLEDVVREVVRPMLAGSAIHLEMDFARGTSAVSADRDQMAQLVRNIISNALEAMGTTGSLRISAASLESDGSGQLPPGMFVQVSFADTGPGIPQDHLGRIFEPYFSTRPDSAGLGLTVCYSIVRKHGGQIEASSGDEGAEIRIWLPAAAEVRGPEGSALPCPGTDLRGRRVLVMDDDPLVLETFLEMLRSLGMETGSARDGSEAVQRFLEAEHAKKPWDILILDLVVPGGMGGLEALSRMRRVSKSARAIVSSGYSADTVLSDYRENGFDGSLRKPFTLAELRDALQEALKEG